METKAREFLLKKCEKPTIDRDFNAIEVHSLKFCDPKDIEAERILKYIRVIEYSAYEKLQKRVEELEGDLQAARSHAEVMEHKATRVNQMLRELKAENKKMRSLLSEIYLDASVDLQGVEENFEIAIKETLGEVKNG